MTDPTIRQANIKLQSFNVRIDKDGGFSQYIVLD